MTSKVSDTEPGVTSDEENTTAATGAAGTTQPEAEPAEPIKVPVASWPSSLPGDEEAHVMSIVCGNSHLHWALHNDGRGESLLPNLFWRTPHLSTDDFASGDTFALSRHMPQYAHSIIFGVEENGNLEQAIETSQKRPEAARIFSVYIISTNLDQLQYLARMWSEVPSRLFQLQGEDFFSEREGRYNGMGVDRLATLRGAGEQWGYPALVFDGGTATTYTASDCDGNILGGGIGPGLALKAKSLAEHCDALPLIDPREFIDHMNQAIADDKGKRLPLFATNTKEAMMVQIMNETAHACRGVIKRWLEVVGPDETETTDKGGGRGGKSKGKNSGPDRKIHFVKGSAENVERNVLVTGGDGDLISHLIQADYSKIIEGKSPIVIKGFHVLFSKYVIHYGIQAALMDRLREQWSISDRERFLQGDEDEKKDVEHMYLNKRVAKWFEEADANGSHYYRGTISKVFRGEAAEETVLFHIVFDDGDEEDVEIDELDELVKSYNKLEARDSGNNGEDKKSKAGKKKGNARSRSKKRNADADAAAAAAVGADSPTPKMPVPRQKERQKKPKIDYAANPGQFVRQRVAKDFGEHGLFFGTITGFSLPEENDDHKLYWKVVYDDNDKEDMEEKELRRALRLYDARKDEDTEKPSVNDGVDGKPEKEEAEEEAEEEEKEEDEEGPEDAEVPESKENDGAISEDGSSTAI